ncbi:hypothetical protein [Shinella sp. G-2]|uniref:hypothetical protein n=1 Tax=Shinella sp. G-2 TaxID=3133141 RepID=UPI003D0823FD
MPEDLKKPAGERASKADGRRGGERSGATNDVAPVTLDTPADAPAGAPIDTSAGLAPPPPSPTVAVTIRRDLWDALGNRHHKGTVVDMPIEAAMDALETGSVSRLKA